MTRKPADHGAHDHEGIIGYVARVKRECQHAPPRRVTGMPMGITDTCKCGATTYVLRHHARTRCGHPGKRWDYWKGPRP
jgi:hypothetical protein